MPAVAWIGVAVGALGLFLRLWAMLTLRERYTRTLLIHANHTIERGGPYRFVRHPGYLGSMMTLNGIGLASENTLVFVASMIATLIRIPIASGSRTRCWSRRSGKGTRSIRGRSGARAVRG